MSRELVTDLGIAEIIYEILEKKREQHQSPFASKLAVGSKYIGIKREAFKLRLEKQINFGNWKMLWFVI